MNLRSFIQWNDDITPGERIAVPARILIPTTSLWIEAVRLFELADKSSYWLGSRPLNPLSPQESDAPVYQLRPGETWFVDDEDTPRSHYRYLGVYRAVGLWPDDWATGTITFDPIKEEANHG